MQFLGVIIWSRKNLNLTGRLLIRILSQSYVIVTKNVIGKWEIGIYIVTKEKAKLACHNLNFFQAESESIYPQYILTYATVKIVGRYVD